MKKYHPPQSGGSMNSTIYRRSSISKFDALADSKKLDENSVLPFKCLFRHKASTRPDPRELFWLVAHLLVCRGEVASRHSE